MRQKVLVDSHLVTEERKLLFLGFEINEVLISDDKVERDEPGSDVFGRVHTSETDILAADCFIKVPREKMKDAAMAKVFLRAGVFPFHYLSSKGNAALAGLGLDEMQELLAREISGMSGHKV
jgi:hypothetical protein